MSFGFLIGVHMGAVSCPELILNLIKTCKIQFQNNSLS